MIKNFVFVVFLLALVEGRRRWHTSQTSLIKLYDLQKKHFNAVNGFLDFEMKRLEGLEAAFASLYEWHHAVTNTNTYFHNHINGILNMNRILQQLHEINNLINNEYSMAALNAIDEDSDLCGDHVSYTVQGLRRLQRFYHISASEMVTGRFMDRNIGDEINACECYVIASHCFENGDMGGALDWGAQAYDKWMDTGYPNCVDIENLDLYVVGSSLHVGYDYRTLFDHGYPYSINTKKFRQYYSLMSAEMNIHKENTLDIFDSFKDITYDNAYIKFEALCTHGKSNRMLTKDLQCRYQTRNSAYRILMPFKEEDVDTHPYIKIYHNFLYDGEIEKIKSIARKNMDDALVVVGNNQFRLIEIWRSGQVSWIDEGEKIFELIDVRVKCLTDLSFKFSDLYQVVNYGLGGHYLPHHDAFQENTFDKNREGNRLATLLFYMSDVPNDGYTVFPMRDIVVPVEKGLAIFWYGLHSNSGEIYAESLHGSCPLLKGNKWIMTKWFYEGGQTVSHNWEKNI